MTTERNVTIVDWGPEWMELAHDGPLLDYGDRFTEFGVTRRVVGFKPDANGIPNRQGITEAGSWRRVKVRTQEEGGKPEAMLMRDVEAYAADKSRPPLRMDREWIWFAGDRRVLRCDYYLPD